MTRCSLVALVCTFGLTAPAWQAEYEVVSVKPANPELSQGGISHSARSTKGQWEARNLYLKDFIRSAYRINDNQIAGGPNWLGTAGWDVDAKYPAGATPAQYPQMMQAMLADRFHLKVHWETRTLPVYLLVIAKNGLKLKESSDPQSMSAGMRMIKYSAASMQELADQLAGYLGKQVLDRTELKGRYSIDLQFAQVDPGSPDASTETRPSIFQALQEQAGLRLDSGRGPVQVLVIDSAEKPSEN